MIKALDRGGSLFLPATEEVEVFAVITLLLATFIAVTNSTKRSKTDSFSPMKLAYILSTSSAVTSKFGHMEGIGVKVFQQCVDCMYTWLIW